MQRRRAVLRVRRRLVANLAKLLDGRANPYFLRPYVEANGPFANRNPDKRDIVNGDLAYQLTPSGLPRWLSWIGTQRFNAHLERYVNDTENYTYGQWIGDDHAWTNRANRVASALIVLRNCFCCSTSIMSASASVSA